MSNETSFNSPEDIDYHEANAEKYNKYLRTLDTYSIPGIIYRLKNYASLLVVRNPFDRLLSAYRSKFMSGNVYFDQVYGTVIRERYRIDSMNRSVVLFEEFVQYLIDLGTGTKEFSNPHWVPINQLCLPCLVDYKYVGKLETLQDDMKHIFQQVGYKRDTFPGIERPNKKFRTAYLLKENYSLLTHHEIAKLKSKYALEFLLFLYDEFKLGSNVL